MARLGRGNSVVRWPWVGQTVLAVVLLATLLQAQSPPSKPLPKPPATRTDNVTETLHGVEVTDPYRWLEDQEAAETRAWIAAQNKYTDALLRDRPGRAEIAKRLGEFLKVDSVGRPVERGGQYFFSKRRADQDLSVLYVRSGLAGADEVLVDPHPMSADHTTSVQWIDVSRDGTRMAYAVRQGGADEIEVRILNMETRKDLPDVFPTDRYFSFSITPDKRGVYYVRHGKEGPRLYYHTMGAPLSEDKEIFGKGFGPEKILYHWLSEDGQWLLGVLLHGSAADRTEVYLYNTTRSGPVVPVVNDIPARFFPVFAGDMLLLHTNWKAPLGRVLAASLQNPGKDNWKEFIAESNATLEDISAVGGRVIALYTENASTKVKVCDGASTFIRDIPLPAIGTVVGMSGRWESKDVFYTYESFLIASTVMQYDVSTGEQKIWARRNVPIEGDKYEVKQVWYSSKDGTRVPMFVVYPRGMKFDGSSPALLTGYGGFSASSTPYFTADAAVWVERGGVYALANLRGGGEFGEAWHKAGMLEKKQNVFDDFIAAAEWLIANKYTNSTRLAISGESNGGLLVGAALAQRPELFGAVVCSYPLLDMVRYHKFLVARFWVREYGSAEDAAQFRFIHAYSPYHNISPGAKYPAVLFVTGDSDTRVAPLHARKMTALMQAASGSERPILLRYDTKAGHSGGIPVSKLVDKLAEELAFLFWQLDAPPSQSPSSSGRGPRSGWLDAGRRGK